MPSFLFVGGSTKWPNLPMGGEAAHHAYRTRTASYANGQNDWGDATHGNINPADMKE